MTANNQRLLPRLAPLNQLRFKIASPYAFLAIVVAFVAALLITRLLTGSLEERFQNALLDAGRLAADAVVLRERDLLATLRAAAFTQGLPEAVHDGDQAALRQLIEPLAVNDQADSIDILDAGGHTLFSIHHDPNGGPTAYRFDPIPSAAQWEFVQQVLRGEVDEQGDKFAGLAGSPWAATLYIAGPVKLDDQLVGVILVGESLARLAQRLDEAALARVVLYDLSGQPIASTLDIDRAASATGSTLAEQARTSIDSPPQRPLTIADRPYLEILSGLRVRSPEPIGLLGVALSAEFLATLQAPALTILIGIFSFLIVCTLLIGVWLATYIVRPVRQLSRASRRVAQGHLDVSVEVISQDEIGTLAEAFNAMVGDLREGRLYRDILGRTASPEVAEQLRKVLSSGKVQLAGQEVEATILYTDIRGFTTLAERYRPKEVMALLNEHLTGAISLVVEHGGIVNKFGGDSMLAFFGVLPAPRPAAEGALQAVKTALALQAHLARLNQARAAQGRPRLRKGIGVNTGPVVAGTLGSPERLEFTLIGDAVNVAQRLSDLNKSRTNYDVFISRATYDLIRMRINLPIQPLGPIQVRGRGEPIEVYAVGGYDG